MPWNAAYGHDESADSLTDAQLRATPVQVSVPGSIPVTDNGGSLTVDGPLTDSQLRAAAIQVELPPGGGGLTDAELRAVPVPVVGTVDVTGPLTDLQLRAVAVPVSGTFFQSTQPVSGPLTDGQLRASAVPVSGAFFQATQPVSGPLTDTQLRATAVPVSHSGLTDSQLRAAAVPVSMTTAPPEAVAIIGVTVTAAAAAAATLTLSAAGPGLFHCITHLQIVKYNSAAVTGTATPVLVTSTNLPGSPVWTFPRFGAIGQIGPADVQPLAFTRPLRSAVANTNTTIVCPATTGVLWRVTAFYYTAV